jgi:hypothetical protein
MSGRFAEIRRSVLLFLLLLTLPLSLYAQSRHYKDDKLYGASAHCTTATPVAGMINVKDEPILSSPEFATIFWFIQYDASSIYALNTTCVDAPGGIVGWPYSPASRNGAGGGTGSNCDSGSGAGSGRLVAGEIAIACQHGYAVAARAARTFCLNALGRGFNVQVGGVTATPDAAGEALCKGIANEYGSPSAPPAFPNVTIQPPGGGNSCGFKIVSKSKGGADGLEFQPHPGNCKDIGVLGGANAVLTSSVDMLHFYYVQVDPQLQSSGTLTFKLWRRGNTGPTQDCTFNVNLTPNVATLHDNIRDGFNNTCASVGARANRTNRQDSHSRFKDLPASAGGYPVADIVEINNAGAKLELVEVSSTNSVPLIYTETSDAPFPDVPVLNPWGVALLVLTLLLSSLWLVRRHRLHTRP